VVPDYQRVWRRLGPAAALVAGVEQTRKLTELVLDILGRLVRGRLSFRTLGGPIRIAQESGRAVREGGGEYFGLIAFLSVNVGVLNLVPLLPLDGGHLLLLLIEGLRRRDLSMSVKTWLMNAGAIVVFVLIGFVIYSDLSKTAWFGRFLP
jgi:regulator of sigma E protease